LCAGIPGSGHGNSDRACSIIATVTAITQITCAGSNTGAVTVTATGGTPAYEYQLDGGAFQLTGTFNGLAPGSHTVTVRDANGCIGSVTFTITQPANTDISLGSDFTGNLFVANGDEVTVVYNISELAGKAGTPATLRIFKPAGYNIIFDNAQTSLTIFPNTYTLDNGKWQLTASNSLYYEFSRTGPGGNNSIGCREKVNISFKLKRVTANISTFNLNAQFRAATGELILSNNSNSILMVGE
jgi:SprB repeat